MQDLLFVCNLFPSNDALSSVCVGTLQVQPTLEAWVPPLTKMYVVTHRIVTHSYTAGSDPPPVYGLVVCYIL